MKGVIGVMEPSLETQNMYCSRVFLGSMVSFLTIFCVLSLSPAAVGPNEGSINVTDSDVQTRLIGERNLPLSDDDQRRLTGTYLGRERRNRVNMNEVAIAGTTVSSDSASGDESSTSVKNPASIAPPTSGTDLVPTEPDDGEFSGSA
ncbi:MAG TPA: hypothetical protein VMY41_07815, partial [Thermohalobaculum sp.]|nr:hypothetical protein [Thermohalobaculum sp.]